MCVCKDKLNHSLAKLQIKLYFYSPTAHTPTCCIWVGTDKGNVIMMTVDIESPTTEDQPRIVKLINKGNVTSVFAYLR